MHNHVFAIFAHPDDEVLACGGALAKHISLGDHVTVLILGTGLASREKAISLHAFTELKSQAIAALSVIGVTDIIFEDFPDNQFDNRPLLELVQLIEKHINNKAITHVYTHYYGDLNIDHQYTCKAVMTAFRPHTIRDSISIFACEVNSATEWGQSVFPTFTPNYFIDIEQVIDKKADALLCYKSEIREWPHPRSKEGLYVLAKQRGMQSGLFFAEAFKLLLSVQR